MKLATLTRTKENDDSSSTHQLADLETGSPRYDGHGPQTVITGAIDHYPPSRDSDKMDGIYVRNEMTFYVERAREE